MHSTKICSALIAISRTVKGFYRLKTIDWKKSEATIRIYISDVRYIRNSGMHIIIESQNMKFENIRSNRKSLFRK